MKPLLLFSLLTGAAGAALDLPRPTFGRRRVPSPPSPLPEDVTPIGQRCRCGHVHPFKTATSPAPCCPREGCRCRRYSTPGGIL